MRLVWLAILLATFIPGPTPAPGAVNATGPATAGAPAAGPPTVDRTLRVMTFNIRHGAGRDGRVNLERIAAIIRASRAQVVGLQEVDRHFDARSSFADQAAWLGRTLGMRVVFGANVNLPPPAPGMPRRGYGSAILSRAPILQWRHTLLPRTAGQEQRGVLDARLRVRGVPIRVLNAHLHHADVADRLAQVRAVAAMVAGSTEPVVLVGDLNATPGAPELRGFAGRLVDAWVTAGTGPGHTRLTYRVDYVLVSPDVVARSTAVLTGPLVAGASDHLPVVADLVLPGDRIGLGR